MTTTLVCSHPDTRRCWKCEPAMFANWHYRTSLQIAGVHGWSGWEYLGSVTEAEIDRAIRNGFSPNQYKKRTVEAELANPRRRAQARENIARGKRLGVYTG